MRQSLAAEMLFLDAMRAVLPGVESERPASGNQSGLVVLIDDRHLTVEITRASQVTVATAAHLTRTSPVTAGITPVVVADRITADARHELSDAGWSWLDLRGRLRFRSPGVVIDADVPAHDAPATAATRPISGRAALSVAYWLCAHPGSALSPTKDRTSIGHAPSTISVAVTSLHEAGLVDDGRRGVFPDLFWELAGAWRPAWTWVAAPPEPDDLWDDERGTTWVDIGDDVARRWGAPVVGTTGGPLSLLLPGPVDLTIAARRYGSALPGTGAARLAVVPTRLVLDDATRPTEPGGWASAPRLAVALYLAQDVGRGREVLHYWAGSDHVWR